MLLAVPIERFQVNQDHPLQPRRVPGHLEPFDHRWGLWPFDDLGAAQNLQPRLIRTASAPALLVA